MTYARGYYTLIYWATRRGCIWNQYGLTLVRVLLLLAMEIVKSNLITRPNFLQTASCQLRLDFYFGRGGGGFFFHQIV
jgi:hypothetical protein